MTSNGFLLICSCFSIVVEMEEVFLDALDPLLLESAMSCIIYVTKHSQPNLKYNARYECWITYFCHFFRNFNEICNVIMIYLKTYFVLIFSF